MQTHVYTGKEEDIFNATDEVNIYIENTTGKSVCIHVYDCMGKLTEKETYADGVWKVHVPMSGLCVCKSKLKYFLGDKR